jgi:PKD repeat protein
MVLFSGSFTDPGKKATGSWSPLSVNSNQSSVSLVMANAVRSLSAVTWDFGDGATASGTLTPTHIYADDGAYTVTLVVTDDLGGVGIDTLVVIVNNMSPSLAPIADQSVVVGEALTLTAVFTDPGWLDTHTAVIDWGDGFAETLNLAAGLSGFDFAHAYDTAGAYTVPHPDR